MDDDAQRQRDREKAVQALYGNAVKSLRVKNKLSQEDLAAKAGISRTLVQGIEKGRTGLSSKNVASLAFVFDVAPAELLLDSNSTDAIALLAEVERLDQKGRKQLLKIAQTLGSADEAKP